MENSKDLSEYVYIGVTGKLIFFAQDHPEYGCIPLIALKELADGNTDLIMWLYDMEQTYFDDDQKRLD